MANNICVTGEWYHCYNRGTDKRIVFEDITDYERFLTLLYVSNGTNPIRISDQRAGGLSVFLEDKSIDRGEPLVEIGAYALMPNHPHLVLKQIADDGIARFMQKVFTGYTMYFNLKNKRTGALFAGTYKSQHVPDDQYLKRVVAYVLLNPAGLFASEWKKGMMNLPLIEKQLLAYRYSSLQDFLGSGRQEKKIVSEMDEYYDEKPTLNEMLSDAISYYQERSSEV
jgi:putative transposase